MERTRLALGLTVLASLLACGTDRTESRPTDAGGGVDTGSRSDAGISVDAAGPLDANGPTVPITCDCDATGACDRWCYCDTDCPDPCSCDSTSWCDSGCECDTACEDAVADLYPYNRCHNNSDCNGGGFCAKGACINFCNPAIGCGFGFECLGDTCLYACTGPADCIGETDCCVDGACLPEPLCASTPGPAGWTCAAEHYAAGDGCDCGCGVTDPDCSDDGTCDWCHDSGAPTFLCPMPPSP